MTVFLLLALSAVGARLFDLEVIHGQQARQQAEQQHSAYLKIFPSRGEIKLVDKISLQDIPVATNIKNYLVYAVPPDIQNATATAGSLAGVLSMAAADILPKLTDLSRKYVPIKKQLTDAEQAQIQDLKLPGIYLDSEDKRFYPENDFLSQALGFVGYNQRSQKVGLYGLEKYFEKDLAGSAGEVYEEKDTSGAWIFGAKREITPATDGVNLVLTIDKTIQFQAEQVLKDAVTKHGADSGNVLVLDPKTGAILAMAGYPDFDLNNYGKVTDPSVYNNLNVVGNYEPGSTFKAITMASAIDAGKIAPDTTYVDKGEVTVDNYTIKNAEPGGHGQITMTEALDLSLNTGAIFAENQLGNQAFAQYLQSFGFGKKTGVELTETAGDLNGLKGNITVNYDTASFGQGISVTPLQMAVAYAALANGGKLMRPYIVQSKIYPDGKVVTTQPQQVGQPVSAKAANAVTAMLVDVVENGLGKRAKVDGYFIAGKTGTAQVARKDGKSGYEPDDNIGSFIGYGPVENPQFVMVVRIDHPRDVKFAESTAAPAWGQLAQFILNYLHVAPTQK
ncbi:MAG: penicillin-binding protein 2 [Patescibacteria group bacterium]|nr:penicillin-binding protein 2 [Patescibacteria group bacterium]